MGGCSINVASNGVAPVPTLLFPNARSTSTSVIKPMYNVSFNSDPRSATSPYTADYGWIAQDSDDVACGINAQHQGLGLFNGDPNVGTQYSFGPYVNMSALSGPNAVSTTTAFPSIIGGTTLSAGSLTTLTAGWTIEIAFKPQLQATWAELINIGAIRPANNTGACLSDIIVGYVGSSSTIQISVCDGFGTVYNIANLIQDVVEGQWYHLVFTFQALQNGNANWSTIKNSG